MKQSFSKIPVSILSKIVISAAVLTVGGAGIVSGLNQPAKKVEIKSIHDSANTADSEPADNSIDTANESQATPNNDTESPSTVTNPTVVPVATPTITNPGPTVAPFVVNTDKQTVDSAGITTVTCYYSWSDASVTSKLAGSFPTSPGPDGTGFQSYTATFSCPEA